MCRHLFYPSYLQMIPSSSVVQKYTKAGVLKHILYSYERASRQTINFSKIDVSFNKRVSAECRNQITLLLDIRGVLSHNKYLEAPTFVGRCRKKPFLCPVDRIKKRMSQWMDKLASWAWREVLIKVVPKLSQPIL